jgi:hypothetical protein
MAEPDLNAMSDTDLDAYIARLQAQQSGQQPSVWQDVRTFAKPTLQGGMLGLAGAPAEMGALAVKGLGKVGEQFDYPALTQFASELEPNVERPFGFPASSEALIADYEKKHGPIPQAQTASGKYIQSGLAMAPAVGAAAALGPESVVRTLLRGAGSAVGSTAAGQAADTLGHPEYKPAAEMGGALAGWGLPGAYRGSNILPTRTENLIAQGQQRLSQEGQQLAARTRMNIDPQVINDVNAAVRNYTTSTPISGGTPPTQIPMIHGVQQFLQANQGRALNGNAWWDLRRQLNAFNGSPEATYAAGAIRRALDAGMERSFPQEWGPWNDKWAASEAMAKEAQARGSAGGELNPAAVASNVMRKSAPIYNLARAGENVMTPVEPSKPGLLSRLAGAGIGGAASYAAGSTDPMVGALLGATVAPDVQEAGRRMIFNNPVSQAVLRKTMPISDPVRAADAEVLRQAGVPVTAGQQTGSPFLTRMEGAPAAGQQRAMTDAMLRQMDVIRRQMPHQQLALSPQQAATVLLGGAMPQAVEPAPSVQ